MTRSILFYVLVFAALPFTVLCVEPGGRLSLEMIRKNADPVAKAPSVSPCGIQALVFLDAATRDAPGCFRMLEELKSRLSDLREGCIVISPLKIGV